MILPTPRPLARQVASTCRDLVVQPGLPFAQHLPAEQVHQIFHAFGGEYRERIYNPAVTLWTFLTQVRDPDHSCQQAVDRLIAHRVASGLRPCSADTGAYCRARGRFPEAVLRELTRQLGRGVAANAEAAWRWKGRPVKVVDGTGLSMPDTRANQRAYPQPASVRAGLGFPLARLVVVFSLAVGTVLDAAVGRFEGKGTGEVSLFRSLDDVLEVGDVLVGDRIYSNFWDVARAQARGVDVVMRLHAGRKGVWFRGRGHSKANKRLCWRQPPRPEWMTQEEYAAYPERLRLRAVCVDVRQRGFRTKRLVVVTTLRDPVAYPAADLAALYRRRWQAELNLRSLKVTLQMDILRGKSPDIVRKEVWAHLLTDNIVRGLMAQAARQAQVRPDELSFAGALQAVNAFLPKLEGARSADEVARLGAALVAVIASQRVGDRPDRVEPRAIKRRPKNYPRLRVPRPEARRQLKNGATPKEKKR
jgi:Transposase DDE domain